LHVSQFGVFHGNVQGSAALSFHLQLFTGRGLIRIIDTFHFFLGERRGVELAVDETIIQLDDIGVINLLHHLDLVDDFFVLLATNLLFDFDLFQRY
jgi:hypothetical protein